MKAHPTVQWFRLPSFKVVHGQNKFERRVQEKKYEGECLDMFAHAKSAKTRVAELREKGLLK